MNNDSSVSPWPNMEAVLIWRVHVLQLKWIYVERPPLFLLSAHREQERERKKERGTGTNADETINLSLTGSSDVKRMAALPSFDINARHKFINLLTDTPALRTIRLLFRLRKRRSRLYDREIMLPRTEMPQFLSSTKIRSLYTIFFIEQFNILWNKI